MSIFSKPCHHRAILEDAVLRGGRMTKFKGQVASCAPVVGLVMTVVALGASPDQAFASTCGNGVVVATGGSCNLNANGYNPANNDNQVGATIVDSGNSVTLIGSAASIQTGAAGVVTYSFPQLFATGNITSGAQYADPSNPASLTVIVGPKSQTVTAPDPVTGGNVVVSVFDNSNIADYYAQVGVPGGGGVVVNTNVGDNQYINARLGTVNSSGGTLNVNIGVAGAAPSASTNYINMVAKQTDLTYADGTGSAQSRVVWQSQNQINLGSVSAADLGGGTGSVTFTGFSTSVYKGAFTAFDGSAWTVNNAADLKAYNSFLINALQSGALSPANYQSAFDKAYTTTVQSITYNNLVVPGDDAAQPIGTRSVIHAVGSNAVGQVASGAILDLNVVTQDVRVSGGLGTGLLADQGAQIVNDGTISVQRVGGDGGSAMYARGGSLGVNNGVINLNFVSVSNPALRNAFSTSNVAMGASGANSRINNAGVINAASPGSIAMDLAGGSQGSNSGVINVGVINMGPDAYQAGAPSYGARVAGSSFTNTGTIYLGRGPQSTLTGATGADTGNTATPLVGIRVTGGAAGSATNAGTITIGSLVQGSTAIQAAGSSGPVVNSGIINVNGAASAVPAVNYGINALNSTNVLNSGTITLNGVNGVGLNVLAVSTAASATSTGTINVAGGADPSSGARNFGVWAEGQNGKLASAVVDGPVNLTGIGGIGVHARGLSQVAVGAGAVPNFVSGSDQIGFFIYGSQATVAVAASAMDVSTDRSTLFRIADGAGFNASGLAITTSGADSTGILGTGAGTVITADTGTFDVSGDGAQALVIEGGAVGTIGSGSMITLGGANSTAAIVDGQKHDLAGNAVGAPDATTKLTVAADVTSAQPGVEALVARNLATLDLTGDVTLTGAGSTGILAESGGKVNVTGSTVDVNGWATRAEGPAANSSTFTITNASLTGSTGLFDASNGAVASFSADNSALNGLITTAAGSVSNVSLTNGTVWTQDGASNMTSLVNNATIDTLDGAADDVITTGTYSGNGVLKFDADFVNDVSDKLVVTGDVIGGITSIHSNALTSTATGNDVLVVDVAGASPAGMFMLTNGPLNVGGRIYTLEQVGADWFLKTLCNGNQTVSGASGAVLGCVTPDTLSVTTGGVVTGDLEGAGDVDIIKVDGDAVVTGVVRGGGNGGDMSAASDAGDFITIDTTGSVGGVDGDLGDDQIWLLGGQVKGDVLGNVGNDRITLNGGTVAGAIGGGEGDDAINLLAGMANAVTGDAGNDTITLAGATVTNAISGGDGDDGIYLRSGKAGSVTGDAGNDTIALSGATVTGNIDAGAGDDMVTWSSGTTAGINGGTGSDTVTVTAASYNGSQVLDGGDDASSADGWVDRLALNGVTATANAGKIVNWEVLDITGGSDVTAAGIKTETVNVADSKATLTDLAADTVNAANAATLIDGASAVTAVNTCGGSTTVGGTSAVGNVLGCASNDAITVKDNAVIAGAIEGAGGSDTIAVLGNASAATVRGGGNGQDASSAADGADTITIATTKTVDAVFGDLGDDMIALNAGTVGSVSGGDGNDAITLAGATVTGTLAGDSGNDLITLASGKAAIVDGGTGNDIVNWNGPATVSTITLGDGSDVLNVNSPAVVLTGVTLAGGGNVVAGDGEDDALNLNAAWSGNLSGAKTTGWEAININGGKVGVSDAAITAGTISVNAGGTLDGSNSLVATANVNVSAGSTLLAGNATGTNGMRITGNLANAGTVDLRGPAGQQATGDRLTVGGSYAGGAGSKLVLDTRLGDSASPTDRLVVGGNTLGATALVINNVGGTGALTTGDGIKIVQVDGTSAPGSFALANGPIDVGAFRYDAYNGGLANPNDQDWYLRSQTRNIVPPTVSLARVSGDLGLAMLGTLHERVGEQEHLGLQESVDSGAVKGLWGRMIGKDYSETSKSSAFGNMRSNGQFGGMQMGLDLYRGASPSGARTLVGAYGGYAWSGTGDFQVTPRSFPAGSTRSDGWIAGLYATHYAASGLYVDAVVQGSWLDHKASAIDGTTLKTKSDNWLASIELGKPVNIGSDFKFEPQGQLIYGNTKLDTVQDSTGVLNTFDVEDSLTGRLGFRLKRTWDYNPSSEGGLFTAYLKANLWGTLAGGDTRLKVGVSEPGEVRTRTVWGDVGFGTTFSLSAKAEFFADIDVEFGLNQGATALSGHTGFRLRF